MYVCLMRHGKAEPFYEGCVDSQRELVEKGRRQAALMASLARQWWPAGPTVLWSSPYVRACQTAVYINNRLSCTAFHTHPAIASGDLQAVYRDILCRQDGHTLCIIGHSPYLDQWARQWTGTPVDFKTGSMALFAYDPYEGNAGTASLLFYIHPKGARLIEERQKAGGV